MEPGLCPSMACLRIWNRHPEELLGALDKPPREPRALARHPLGSLLRGPVSGAFPLPSG